MKQLLPGNAITGILKKSGKVFLYLLLLTGTICFVTAAPVVLKTPAWMNVIFFITAVLLFIGGFRFCHAHWLLGIISGSFFLYFLLLTPQEQFADVKMQRIFAVAPDIEYLENGKFKVINMRVNRYPVDYDENSPDYQDVFRSDAVFDPAEVVAVQFACVYWGDYFYVAHNMLNFNFSDGRSLAVSIEPGTPEKVSRDALSCLCKQQKLLIILSDPQDLFDLRTKIRGEDIYLYELDLTPQESRILLESIVAKVHFLARQPEFYHLTNANCITALWPSLKKARPELQSDWRLYFNGFIDRMLFEQNLLKHRHNESFESLKSRSFVKGKSQGKL